MVIREDLWGRLLAGERPPGQIRWILADMVPQWEEK